MNKRKCEVAYGKRKFYSQHEAIRAALNTSKKYGHFMRIYPCHDTRGGRTHYHLTSQAKNVVPADVDSVSA